MKLEMAEVPLTSPFMETPSMLPTSYQKTNDQSMPIRKKPSFLSIDHILGKREEEIDDDVFEVESGDNRGKLQKKSYEDIDDGGINIDIPKEDENMDEIDELGIDKDGKGSDSGDSKNDKQTPSYTAIIAQAILSSTDQKLPLGCIYEYISEHFPEFLKKGQGWRNCVRHNLSLSECFVKAGRARNGRGNYWGIHPRYIKNFSKGDFRKRRASHRPRNRDLGFASRVFPHYYSPFVVPSPYTKSYVPMGHRIYSEDSIMNYDTKDHGPSPLLSGYKPWLRASSSSIETMNPYGNIHLGHKMNVIAPASTYETIHPYSEQSQRHQHIKNYNLNASCSCHYHCCQTTSRS